MSVETQNGPFAGYAPPDERPPLGSFAAFAGVFNAGFGAALVAAARRGRLPENVKAGDVALIGVASHKLSRLIAKDKVTAFIRAPFTEYEGSAGPAEFEESVRGKGLRRGIGELIACPYCLGLWASAGLHVGLLFAPRTTRVIASTFTALTISDFLQIAYKAAEDRGLGGS
ncbi:MAG TPA: DUF1360 domain-containing protein [Thermoleophilaceae bacterium]|jgi:hypothetical protein